MEYIARISSGYRWRLLLVVVMCLGMGLYFIYDGFIGYPSKNALITEKTNAWKTLVEDQGDLAAYKELAIEKKWWTPDDPEYPDDPPRPQEEVYSTTDIFAQKLLGTLCCAVGLFFGYVWVSSGGRWVKLADGKLSNSKGLEVALDDIASIDSARWKNKGIALVHFENEAGKHTILLDDWKFDVKATREIYDIVREHVEGPLDDEATDEAGDGKDDEAEEAALDTQA